jgi:hypothetical protein
VKRLIKVNMPSVARPGPGRRRGRPAGKVTDKQRTFIAEYLKDMNDARAAQDSYSVRLLWDQSCPTWGDLTRTQQLTSSLEPLLGAMGTDLWYLHDQPVRPGPAPSDRAA